uniref:NADH dehydrogenase subunit 6 n=1 Tax=Leptopilina myrica (nomen nudum) TaxID=2964900 RepID=A0AAU7BNE4_9HYME
MHNFQMILIFLFIFILLGVMSVKKVSPMMMGVVMFSSVIITVMFMSLLSSVSVYSMIFYMVMIGGLLILFLYFNSFAVGGVSSFSYLELLGVLNKFVYFCLFSVLTFKMEYLQMFVSENNLIKEMKNFIMESSLDSFKLVYVKFDLMVIFLLLYLLYMLIMIVKILFLFKPKSMRQMI